jgi:hypothetical protein
VPALPSWPTSPLWDQFTALLPTRPTFDPGHPLGCHRRRVSDRVVFDKLLQIPRFGCSCHPAKRTVRTMLSTSLTTFSTMTGCRRLSP